MKKPLFLLLVFWLSLTGFSQQGVTIHEKEKDAIMYMREEEKLARDVYNFLYAKWNVNPFGNISRSEQRHMDRMQMLITSYKLNDPVEKTGDKQGLFVNSLLQNYYNEHTAEGSNSLVEALKVGAKIEELDITDLEERIKLTNQQDIISTFSYLIMASENHLRAFVRRMKMQGVNYEPAILSKAAFDKIIGKGN